MNEMKKLDNSGLNEVMDLARELMVMNGKMTFKPGMKVFMVQKTKKTPKPTPAAIHINDEDDLTSLINLRKTAAKYK